MATFNITILSKEPAMHFELVITIEESLIEQLFNSWLVEGIVVKYQDSNMFIPGSSIGLIKYKKA